MKKTILTVMDLEDRERAKLEQSCPGAAFLYRDRRSPDDEETRDCEAIVGNVAVEKLGCFPKLRWLQAEYAGVDNYLAALPAGVTLTNASGAYGYAIAESMIGAVFMLYKKLDLYYAQQKAHVWRSLGEVRDVGASEVLVIGLGDIGSRFAMRMKALGCRVTGIRRLMRECPSYADRVVSLDRLDDELPQADIVALCLPATNSTVHLLNYAHLAKMKPGAVLLNVGRGSLIVTDDLVRIIREGRLGGVYLDVTDPEPLGPHHPLWDLPRTIITPHVTGNYSLRRTYESVLGICIENINRWCSGDRLINQVDRQAGYRKNV